MRRQTQSIGDSQWNDSFSILALSRFLLTCALVVLWRAPSAPAGIAGAPNDLYVTSGNAVEQFDGATGVFVGTLAAGGVTAAEGLVFLPAGDLLVVGRDDDLVNRYDGCAGTDLGVFAGAGELASPRAVALGPNGNVYVASANTNTVIEYDGETGAFVRTYTDAALSMPTGLAFDANGNLYVSSAGNDTVIRFAIGGGNTADIDGDGDSDAADVSLFVQVLLGEDTGDPQHVVRSDIDNSSSADGLDIAPFVDGFLNGGATGAASVFATGGGLTDPRGLVFDANGDLLVSSFATDEVLWFDGVSGAFVDAFVTGNGLDGPVGIAFGRDGHLYVAGSNTNKILRYDGATGGYIDDFVTGVASPRYLTFKPPFTIDEVSPNEAGLCNAGFGFFNVALTMTGSNLTDCPSLTALLTRAGESTIIGETVDLNGTQFTAKFNVASAVTGPWNLEVWDGFGNTRVLSDAVTLRDCTLQPRSAWGGAVKTVFVEDSNPDIVYIGSGRRLVILSVTDNIAGGVDVVELGSVEVGALVQDVAVKNGIAYVATKGGPNQFLTVDVSNPQAPQVVQTSILETFIRNPEEIDLWNSYVFVCVSGSIQVVDVSDPGDPDLVNTFLGGLAGDMQIVGDLLYVVTKNASTREVRVYQIETTPFFQLSLLASAPLPQDASTGTAIAVDGEYVYATTKNSTIVKLGSALAVYRFDQSDPQAPALIHLTTRNDFFWLRDVAASNGHAFVADWAGGTGSAPSVWDVTRGIAIFDMSNPATPVEVGTYKPHGGIRGVVVQGTRAYVMDEGQGLVILDVSEPSVPQPVGGFHSPTYLRKMAKQGNLLYVNDYWNGIAILDVSDAAAPQLVGVYQTPLTGVAIDHRGIRAVGDRAYLGAGYGGVEIVDISDPANPTLLGARRLVLPELRVNDLDVRGDIAYVSITSVGANTLANFMIADPMDIQKVGEVLSLSALTVRVTEEKIAHIAPKLGHRLYDESDPQAPAILGAVSGRALDLVPRGDYVFVADNNSPDGGLRVHDVSDPTAPFEVEAARLIAPQATAISVNGTRAYLLGQDPVNQKITTLHAINISSPTSPAILERIPLPAADIESVLARDGYAYVTGREEGLTIVEFLCESGGGAPGACCLENSECMDGVTASDCDCIFGGVFQGEGTTCADDSCTGACCTASACVEGVTQAECVFELDGIYRGNGSDCGVPCPIGACCSDTDGSCAVLTEAECFSTGDTYLGHDTVCETDPPSCPFGQYSNTIDPVTQVAVAGSGLRLADDLTLAGIGARELTYMDLRVFGNGGGPFDVTIALYTDCPGDGGTQIPGTVFSFSNIPDDGSVYTLVVDPVAPSVTIPDTVWMLALFSTPQAGWVVAGEAEVGSTENRYGRGTPWNCNNTFAGAHAGLWANLRCVEGGARSAAVGGSAINASQLRVIRVETEAPLELISPFELQNGNE